MLDIDRFPTVQESRQAIVLPPRDSHAYGPMTTLNRMLLEPDDDEVVRMGRMAETRGAVDTPGLT